MGVLIDGKGSNIRINQEKGHKSDLAYSLPLLLVHPKSYRLIDAGAQLRREFLDWGVFNDDPAFIAIWRNFKKVLKQRNSLLKTKQINQLEAWNTELEQYGAIVNELRREYLNKLQPLFVEISHYFLGTMAIELIFQCGWDDSLSFKDVLVNELHKDLRYGYTHSGAHRDDFSVLLNGRKAKDFVSRGQLKVLMLALKLAQIKLINSDQNNSVCVLIDDLTAELDDLNKGKVIKLFIIFGMSGFYDYY